jgi:hypothetical protein
MGDLHSCRSSPTPFLSTGSTRHSVKPLSRLTASFTISAGTDLRLAASLRPTARGVVAAAPAVRVCCRRNHYRNTLSEVLKFRSGQLRKGWAVHDYPVHQVSIRYLCQWCEPRRRPTSDLRHSPCAEELVYIGKPRRCAPLGLQAFPQPNSKWHTHSWS